MYFYISIIFILTIFILDIKTIEIYYIIYIYIYITWYGYILIYFSLIFNTVVETREKKWGLFSKVG